MNRPVSYIGSANQNLDKVMEPEQFTQVIEAILEGKYSWACVLILRFAGYNPLHYIPYRTYNRLVKDNNLVKPFNKCSSKTNNQKQPQAEVEHHCSTSKKSQPSLHAIQDLAYLEINKEPSAKIRGGWRAWLDSWVH